MSPADVFIDRVTAGPKPPVMVGFGVGSLSGLAAAEYAPWLVSLGGDPSVGLLLVFGVPFVVTTIAARVWFRALRRRHLGRV